MKSLKEQYIKAHERLAECWEAGKWDCTRDYKNDCFLCEIAHKNEGGKSILPCHYCTQHDGRRNCIHMLTFIVGFDKGTIQPHRAKYHRRAIEFLKTQPPERFHKKNIVKGWPELFEIDRQVAEGE